MNDFGRSEDIFCMTESAYLSVPFVIASVGLNLENLEK